MGVGAAVINRGTHCTRTTYIAYLLAAPNVKWTYEQAGQIQTQRACAHINLFRYIHTNILHKLCAVLLRIQAHVIE